MKSSLPLLALVTLAGCATVSPSVPDTYKGPIATVADTGMQDDGSKGQFYVLAEIDGRTIENALRETRGASYGKGFALTSRYTTRNVPVAPLKVKLIGTHQTAAPIQEIVGRAAGTFFSVEGVVDFKPSEGKKYIVTGELKKERSCVWIQEDGASQPATEKACSK
jgi:hypothetical protein